MITKHSKYVVDLLLFTVLLVICAFFLNSCTVAGPVGASMAIGSMCLNKERARITVTEDEKDTKGCEFVKHVKASTYYGGMLLQEKALEKTISDLTHESVEAGANLLLIRSKHKSFNGSLSEGDAYRCQPYGSESISGPVREEKIEESKERAGIER